MALLNIMNPLNPTGTAGYVTEATRIAYSTKTVTDGDGVEQTVLDKSIKEKVDEIASTGTMYDDNTTLKEKVTELVNSQTSILDSATNATSAASQAQSTLQEILQQKLLISEIASEQYNRLNQDATTVANTYHEQIQQIANINNAINEFKASFEVDKDFVVMSQSEYDTLVANSQVDKGTIYFLYES